MYEYQMWAQAMSAPWEDRTPVAHAEALTAVAARDLMPRLTKAMNEVGGGGWEVVSHDLLRLDDGLLMTVLARRPATAGA
jgi:hypothetical protein